MVFSSSHFGWNSYNVAGSEDWNVTKFVDFFDTAFTADVVVNAFVGFLPGLELDAASKSLRCIPGKIRMHR